MALPNMPDGKERSSQGSLFGDEPAPPAADASAFRGCHVHRIRPPVKAHGGKYYLAPKIVPILLSVRSKVTEYLEPCAFGASVFLAMPRMKREILGDINPDVVALWRVLSSKESAADRRDVRGGKGGDERHHDRTGGAVSHPLPFFPWWARRELRVE